MISEPVTPLCHSNADEPLFHCLPEPPAISLAGLLSYAILFGAFFVLPLVLQRVYGESSLISGLRLTAIPVALALLALLSGCFSDRLGARFLTVSGTLMVFASLLLLSYLLGSGSGQLLALTVLLALLGAGQRLFTAPNNSVVTGTVPAADTGEAGSLLNVMRSLGMSLGVSLTSMMLSWQFPVSASEHSVMAELPALEVRTARRQALSHSPHWRCLRRCFRSCDRTIASQRTPGLIRRAWGVANARLVSNVVSRSPRYCVSGSCERTTSLRSKGSIDFMRTTLCGHRSIELHWAIHHGLSAD